MKKYISLLGIAAFSFASLNASGMKSGPDKAKESSEENEAAMRKHLNNFAVLNPYQNPDLSPTLYMNVGYVGGYFTPQNRVIAAQGLLCSYEEEKCERGSLVEFPQSWSNGISLTVGLIDQGSNMSGVVTEFLYTNNNNGVYERTLEPTSLTMVPSYPTKTQNGDIEPIYRAAGNYDNYVHLDAKAFLVRNLLMLGQLSVGFETGLAGTYTCHALKTFYSHNDILALPEKNSEERFIFISLERISSIGPWTRIHIRQDLGYSCFIEGQLAGSGQLTFNDLHNFSRNVSPGDTVSLTYDILSKNLCRLSQSLEASLGLGFAWGFEQGGGLELTTTWSTISRPNYTLLTAPAYGVSSGNAAPYDANFLKVALAMKY